MDHPALLETALRLQRNEQPFALVSVLRVTTPASARPGDKAIVTANGIVQGWIGGGCAQPAVLRTVRQALADGNARLIRIASSETEAGGDRAKTRGASEVGAGEPELTYEFSAERLGEILEFGMTCHSGGTLELFIDPILARPQLTVMGDTPLAAALAALAPRISMPVTVIAHGADPTRFPDARAVFTDDGDGDGQSRATLESITQPGFIVVATQGRRDLQALRLALKLPARAIFLVASERKAQVLKSALLASGESPERVAAIIAPAGQAIGAQNPEEIALAVLAAVVAARRGLAQPNTDLAPPSAPVTTAPAPQISDPSAVPAITPTAVAPKPGPAAAPVGARCCGG